MADDKDWKTKYFTSLQQLEDMETTWYKLEKLLRKAISRISISAKGINDQLDSLLQKIQKHSREKNDAALDLDLEDLSRLLAKMDVTQPVELATEEESEADFHTYLLKLINQLQFDTDYKSRIDEFKSSISSMDSDQCLSNLAEILNELLLHEPTDKISIQQVLVSLIEKIALTHGSSTQLNNIKEKLDNDFDSTEWSHYLDDIITEIHSIIRGINHEKIEMESLIVDVTRQLNEISNVLTDEQSDSLEGRKDAAELQNLMTENVENIQTQVNQEDDIHKLKNNIKNHLDSIKTGVTSFVTRDNERYHKAEKRNVKLQQQIKTMEKESDELQQKLSENRQKLMFDTLTGVRSRLSYDEVLEQELLRWSRYQEAFSFAILDIDHFKRVNDQFGHNAGDKALQIVAKMMSKHIRKTDFLFRIGGEEFVLLLPKTTLQNAQPLVEKIRSSVGSSSFHFKKERVDISLSAGLTTIVSTDNAESIYERADKALYEAKNGGRDQLVIKSA